MNVAFSPILQICKNPNPSQPFTKSQISMMEKLLLELKSENSVYKSSMKQLSLSSEEIHITNVKLQNGIAERRNYLQLLTNKLSKRTKKYVQYHLYRVTAKKRLTKYHKYVSKRTFGIANDRIDDECDNLNKKVEKLKEKEEIYRKEKEDKDIILQNILSLSKLKIELEKMNLKLNDEANKLLKIINFEEIDLSPTIKNRINAIRVKMEKGEQIRNDLEKENNKFDILNGRVIRDYNFYQSLKNQLDKTTSLFEKLDQLFQRKFDSKRSEQTSSKLSSIFFDEDKISNFENLPKFHSDVPFTSILDQQSTQDMAKSGLVNNQLKNEVIVSHNKKGQPIILRPEIAYAMNKNMNKSLSKNQKAFSAVYVKNIKQNEENKTSSVASKPINDVFLHLPPFPVDEFDSLYFKSQQSDVLNEKGKSSIKPGKNKEGIHGKNGNLDEISLSSDISKKALALAEKSEYYSDEDENENEGAKKNSAKKSQSNKSSHKKHPDSDFDQSENDQRNTNQKRGLNGENSKSNPKSDINNNDNSKSNSKISSNINSLDSKMDDENNSQKKSNELSGIQLEANNADSIQINNSSHKKNRKRKKGRRKKSHPKTDVSSKNPESSKINDLNSSLNDSESKKTNTSKISISSSMPKSKNYRSSSVASNRRKNKNKLDNNSKSQDESLSNSIHLSSDSSEEYEENTEETKNDDKQNSTKRETKNNDKQNSTKEETKNDDKQSLTNEETKNNDKQGSKKKRKGRRKHRTKKSQNKSDKSEDISSDKEDELSKKNNNNDDEPSKKNRILSSSSDESSKINYRSKSSKRNKNDDNNDANDQNNTRKSPSKTDFVKPREKKSSKRNAKIAFKQKRQLKKSGDNEDNSAMLRARNSIFTHEIDDDDFYGQSNSLHPNSSDTEISINLNNDDESANISNFSPKRNQSKSYRSKVNIFRPQIGQKEKGMSSRIHKAKEEDSETISFGCSPIKSTFLRSDQEEDTSQSDLPLDQMIGKLRIKSTSNSRTKEKNENDIFSSNSDKGNQIQQMNKRGRQNENNHPNSYFNTNDFYINNSNIYQTEATNNIFINKETIDPFAGEVRKEQTASKTKWAHDLLRSTISRQLTRTHLQIAISEAQYQLSMLDNEITDLEDELLIANFEKRYREHPSFRLVVPLMTLFIPPSASTKTRNKKCSLATQTILKNDKLVKEEKEIQKNNQFLSKESIKESEKLVCETHLTVLEKAYEEIQSKNERMKSTIEYYEERMGIVEDSRNNKDSKEKRLANRYERAVKEGHNKCVELDDRISAKMKELDEIKENIDEQRKIHQILKDRICKERRSENPNVQQMRKTLDGYIEIDKWSTEKINMMEIEEKYLDKKFLEKTDKLSIEKLEIRINQYKEQLNALKNNFFESYNNFLSNSQDSVKKMKNLKYVHWGNGRRFKGATSRSELTWIENHTKQISVDIEIQKSKKRRLLDEIKSAAEKLSLYKVNVPPSSYLDMTLYN